MAHAGENRNDLSAARLAFGTVLAGMALPAGMWFIQFFVW